MATRRPIVAALVLLVTVLAAAPRAALSGAALRRIDEAAFVLEEIRRAPEQDIPLDLWNRAACVLVVPSLKKAAFIFGGEYGNGMMSCRRDQAWSAPVFMRISKGSWGLQIGAQSTDLVLLVMNENGARKLLGSKVSLGAEASVAAGPVGRDVRGGTDAQLRAEILSYSRTQGLFAGVNLTGGVIAQDQDDNEDLYGRPVSPADVLMRGGGAQPAAVRPFMAALEARSRP